MPRPLTESGKGFTSADLENPKRIADGYAAADDTMLAVYRPEDPNGRAWAAKVDSTRPADLPCHAALLESALGYTLQQVEVPAGRIAPGTLVLVWEQDTGSRSKWIAVTPSGQSFSVDEDLLAARPKGYTGPASPAPTCWLPGVANSFRIWEKLETPLYAAMRKADAEDVECRKKIAGPIFARAEKMEKQVVNRDGHFVRKYTDEQVKDVRDDGWAKGRKGCARTLAAHREATAAFLAYWEGYLVAELGRINAQLAVR